MESTLREGQIAYASGVDGSGIKLQQRWLLFGAAIFLVSVPVFFQAPLVRLLPELSLAATVSWLGLSLWLYSRPSSRLWGDLLIGFTWTWLAGSIYWGWLRWEPLWHLPVEAIGLPFVLLCMSKQWGKVGNWFYLGSLFGTVMTDLYFYAVRLIPHWRQLMQVDPNLARPIFQDAVTHVMTPQGIAAAAGLIAILLLVGCAPLRSRHLHYWVFGGAVLSTILVDSLFLLAAIAA